MTLPHTNTNQYLDIPCTTEIPLIQCLDPRAHVNQFWQQKTRPDGRIFAQSRATKVVYGMLKHSAGSALVKQQSRKCPSKSIGVTAGTKVLAATSYHIGQPCPEQPMEGDVVVCVCGNGGRNIAESRTQHRWDILQSWLQRTLEGDKRMMQSLNLLTGKACLQLVLTVVVLEDNGSLKDAALLACMAAWKDTQLPTVGRDLIESQGRLWWKKIDGPITSIDNSDYTSDHRMDEPKASDNSSDERDYRISLTMGIWKDEMNQTHLLADPSSLEEMSLLGSLTIVVNLSTGRLQIDYTGEVPLTAKELAFASKLAEARKVEVSSLLL